MTREERERMRYEIPEAGGMSAWIRQPLSKEARTKQIERMKKFNALAKKFGYARPYPELYDQQAAL